MVNKTKKKPTSCFLCLEESKLLKFINIFKTKDGFNIDLIISKHFWLKPQKNDNKSNSVCCECWNLIKTFHIYYSKIEQAHNNLAATPVIKNDPLEIIDEFIKTEITNAENNINFDVGLGGVSDIGEDSSIIPEWNDVDSLIDLPLAILDEKDSVQPRRRSTRNKTEKLVEVPEKKIKKEPTRTKQIDTICKIEIATESLVLPDINEKNFIIDKKNDDDCVEPDISNSTEIKRRKRSVLRTADVTDEKISKFMPLECDICKSTCSTLATLKSHFRVEHEVKGYAICCNKKFYKRYLLLDHIDTHLNPDHFKCKQCDKVFTVSDCLRRHVQEIHRVDKDYFYCDQCPKKFMRQMLLDRHKAFHNPIENWTDNCEECGKTFPSKFYLKSHVTFTHIKIPNKICHVCGKGVASNRYKKHLLEHDGVTDPKIECDICGAWLQRKYMGTHKINHREAEIIHSCTICGKISPNRRALYIHMRYTHAEKRNHECTVCGKTFKRRLSLKQHMATHTGDNLYNCPYCPKSFTYDSNFHNHKKKEHPKEHEEERKRVCRTDFVKCTQDKQQFATEILNTEDNQQYDSFDIEEQL